ncbi:MAG: AzlD domain-containing protein [Dysosmobacter sp.]
MRLNAIQTLIILLAITVGTVITRFLPPILFPHGKPSPKFLQELCTLLASGP